MKKKRSSFIFLLTFSLLVSVGLQGQQDPDPWRLGGWRSNVLLTGLALLTTVIHLYTPLMNRLLRKAVEDGNLRLAKRFSFFGGDIRQKDRRGNSLLHLAAQHGHTQIVNFLLDSGVGLFLPSDQNVVRPAMTPLHVAARYGHLETLRALLSSVKGFDINKTDRDHKTPLHYAAQEGHTGIVKELISKPVTAIDKKTDRGDSPLHYAVRNEHSGVVEVLLYKNALVSPDNNNQDTPLSEALEAYSKREEYSPDSKLLDIIDLLIGHGAVKEFPEVLFIRRTERQKPFFSSQFLQQLQAGLKEKDSKFSQKLLDRSVAQNIPKDIANLIVDFSSPYRKNRRRAIFCLDNAIRLTKWRELIRERRERKLDTK